MVLPVEEGEIEDEKLYKYAVGLFIEPKWIFVHMICSLKLR